MAAKQFIFFKCTQKLHKRNETKLFFYQITLQKLQMILRSSFESYLQGYIFCSFTFCRFLPIAGGKGGVICRLPAAKETTGKTPCIVTEVPSIANILLFSDSNIRERRFALRSTVSSDGHGALFITRILNPNFLWKFSHHIRKFLTLGQNLLPIF